MNLTPLLGRSQEKQILEKALTSQNAELVAVIGRRRVGKTLLVRTVYQEHLMFQMTGIQGATKKEQLRHFFHKLTEQAGEKLTATPPKDWRSALYLLENYLNQLEAKTPMVIFFDEIPWIASKNSGFLAAFGSFWNDWASMRNVVIVICGSSASWMIERVVRHKGGLHNRVTRLIDLKPFTLSETERYLKSREIKLSRYEIILLYMVTGGVPYYLSGIERGQSANQAINQLCFTRNGFLQGEFSKLYAALFERPDNYVAVVRALAGAWKGLHRDDIAKHTKIPNGGGLTKVLGHLETCGFISSYLSFGQKRKNKLYRLTDSYSLFYLQFVEGTDITQDNVWHRLSSTPAWHSWSGYSFENLCLLHVGGIKNALGISGIHSVQSSYSFSGNDLYDGLQIDLLIDRADHTISLCEIKFYRDNFVINKSYSASLRRRVTTFEEISRTRKTVQLVFISVYGLRTNQHSLGLVDHDLNAECLFTAHPF